MVIYVTDPSSGILGRLQEQTEMVRFLMLHLLRDVTASTMQAQKPGGILCRHVHRSANIMDNVPADS